MVWESIPLNPFGVSIEVYVGTEKETFRTLEQDVTTVVLLTMPRPMPFCSDSASPTDATPPPKVSPHYP